MRAALVLVALLLVAPAAGALVQHHAFPVRAGIGPWAQVACTIAAENPGMKRCTFEGTVGGVDTFRMDVVGAASAIVNVDLVRDGVHHPRLATTICAGSCVHKFQAFSGTIHAIVDVSLGANAVVHAGVGAGSDVAGTTILV